MRGELDDACKGGVKSGEPFENDALFCGVHGKASESSKLGIT